MGSVPEQPCLYWRGYCDCQRSVPDLAGALHARAAHRFGDGSSYDAALNEARPNDGDLFDDGSRSLSALEHPPFGGDGSASESRDPGTSAAVCAAGAQHQPSSDRIRWQRRGACNVVSLDTVAPAAEPRAPRCATGDPAQLNGVRATHFG